MTTAAELLAQTDCADLRAANESLQRQNDILTGRVQRLIWLLEIKEREAKKLEAKRVKLLREMFECDTIIAARNATVAEYEKQIARLAAENAELHEQLHALVVDGLPY